jgi:protein TonB
MKALTINQVAVMSALALHALLLSMQMRPQPLPAEISTKIAIRLVSPHEAPPSPTPSVSAPLRTSIENKNQNHKQLQALPPAKAVLAPEAWSELPESEPVATSAPVGAQQTAEPIAQTAASTTATNGHAVPAPVATPIAARLPDYLAAVRTQVEHHKDYPAFARQLKQQGTVTVRVAIGPDGRLREAVVSASSGHASLDKAALAAVRNAGRFRSPDDFGLGAVTIDIPITYKLI